MASHTDHDEANTHPDIPEVDPSTLPGNDRSEHEEEDDGSDEDAAARYETIRNLALRGDLEFPPEADEIVEALKDTIAQRDENQAKLIRAFADHQNFQRRAANNEREAREMATRGIVSSLIPLIDQFDLALMQDPTKVSAETIAKGVEMIRGEFLRVLANYGVATIAPEVGDEFNPGHHEALMQQPAEGVEPGHVSFVISTGYKLGERVVRPAKVGVAPAENA